MKYIRIIGSLFIFVCNSFGQIQLVTSLKCDFDKGLCCISPANCDTLCNKIVTTTENNDLKVTITKCNNNNCVFLNHWMGGYCTRIIFKDRYMEFRIRSTVKHDTDLTISFDLGHCYPGEICKHIPTIHYKINEPDQWETKLIKLDGDGDTIFRSINWGFPSGYYVIDYIYLGGAAVPPIPTITQPEGQTSDYRPVQQSLVLHGIEIPGRPYDGLVLKAETKKKGLIEDIGFKDLGNGIYVDSATKTAVLQYTPTDSAAGNTDTIVISLSDTIRNTSKQIQFSLKFWNTGLEENQNPAQVYPTLTHSEFTVNLNSFADAMIEVYDIQGKLILSDKMNGSKTKTFNIGAFADGIYFVKIISTEGTKTFKILKK